MNQLGFKKFLSAFALTAVALALAPAAHAAHNLPAGDTGSPLAGGLPANFSTANLLASSMSTVTAPGNAFTATFSSAVYANVADASDQTALSGFVTGQSVLDFVFQVRNSPNSLSAIPLATLFDYAAGGVPNQINLLLWQTAADIDGAGNLFTMGNQQATTADRGANGKTVFINYGMTADDSINMGETSFAFIVRASTPNYAPGFYSAIAGTTATVSSFAPVAAIPEPETYALMLAGLGALGVIARRRRQT